MHSVFGLGEDWNLIVKAIATRKFESLHSVFGLGEDWNLTSPTVKYWLTLHSVFGLGEDWNALINDHGIFSPMLHSVFGLGEDWNLLCLITDGGVVVALSLRTG